MICVCASSKPRRIALIAREDEPAAPALHFHEVPLRALLDFHDFARMRHPIAP